MAKIHGQLQQVQLTLVAPKSNFNKFGNYNYRSCEDILEAVKPLLVTNGLVLTITDEMVMLGDRFYVKAIARIENAEGDSVTTTAYAREEEVKKGMDASQITGSASSYARKYALNGLFCIDDTKDADAINTHGKDEQPKNKPKSQTKSQPTTNEDTESSSMTCNDCGITINQAVKTYSEKNFGRALCMDCQKKNK